MQVDDGAPLERMLAPDEINEALSALHLRNVPVIEVGTDSEAEGMEPDIEAEPLLEEADRISVASSISAYPPLTRMQLGSALCQPLLRNRKMVRSGAACRTMRKLRKTLIQQCWRAWAKQSLLSRWSLIGRC